MENIQFEITDFLRNQALKIRGAQEYADYETYVSAPQEERADLPQSICDHYKNVMRVMEKMASYGNNHWWVMLKSSDVKRTAELASLRSKARVYFQVFDCGVDTMLIPDGQLVNDINDLIAYTKKAITSWIVKNPTLFAGYANTMKKLLDEDKEFQQYLKEQEAL